MKLKTLQERLAVVVLLGLLAIWGRPLPVVAQTVNGAFHGTVTDATGAVIPGVAVGVKNLASGAVRQGTTNDTGFYTITQLPPGHYGFTVSKPGFATAFRADV